MSGGQLTVFLHITGLVTQEPLKRYTGSTIHGVSSGHDDSCRAEGDWWEGGLSNRDLWGADTRALRPKDRRARRSEVSFVSIMQNAGTGGDGAICRPAIQPASGRLSRALRRPARRTQLDTRETLTVRDARSRDTASERNCVALTRANLFVLIAERTHVSRTQAEAVVRSMFEHIAEGLQRGEGIEIRNFGSLSVRSYRARGGWNPRIGRAIRVEERRLPVFRVGKGMRDRLHSAVRIDPDLPVGQRSIRARLR
jgi:integration host factor subunit beta